MGEHHGEPAKNPDEGRQQNWMMSKTRESRYESLSALKSDRPRKAGRDDLASGLRSDRKPIEVAKEFFEEVLLKELI